MHFFSENQKILKILIQTQKNVFSFIYGKKNQVLVICYIFYDFWLVFNRPDPDTYRKKHKKHKFSIYETLANGTHTNKNKKKNGYLEEGK